MIEDKIYYCNLFDCYEGLFSENQENYFRSYFYEDLSLAEISEIYNVTRQAVSQQIKYVKGQLEMYDQVLGLISLYDKIDKLIDDGKELSKEEIIDRLSKIGGSDV